MEEPKTKGMEEWQKKEKKEIAWEKWKNMK
jgi:hypothetical protein